jgi:protein-L-isoaspartate(D-aspartate) O-methyltransferase
MTILPEIPDAEPMLRAIDTEYAATTRWTGRSSADPAVRAALGRVPRDRFVPPDKREIAWADTALSIGCAQTISQPFIVALMTDLLAVRPGDRVLEIGTGSGYQAAVLAELGAEVYSIEIIEALAADARERLAALGYGKVSVRSGDGRAGWSEHAPYQGIIVTAAAEGIPPALPAQLAPGGRLVIPLGAKGGQRLCVFTKRSDGTLHRRVGLPVTFVPCTGGSGR